MGIAQFADNWQNVLLSLIGPDSSGHISGTIHHGGQSATLATADRDSSGDTLRLTYTLGDSPPVTHRAWTLIEATGLRVHYTEPAIVPEFHLNREQGGTNMTGLWRGQMYSRFLSAWREASMSMDQSGELYGGTIDVALVQNAHFQLNTGVTGSGNFQLAGTVRIGTGDYPALLTGVYANTDSLVGNWQAGTNAEIDNGSFAFRRNF